MIQTNWYVITGPPCSGKTTMVERLQERGYAVRFWEDVENNLF